jgi:hypothetical protein
MADLTSSQVAKKLSKDNRLVRLWCQQGRFPNARLEDTPRGPVWVIPESDLNGFEPPAMGRPPKPKQEKTSKASKKSKK